VDEVVKKDSSSGEELVNGRVETRVNCPVCRSKSLRSKLTRLPEVERLTKAMYPQSTKSRQKEIDDETERIVREVFSKYGQKQDCNVM